MTARAIKKVLGSLADPKIAEHSQRFFKTGAGEYGEGAYLEDRDRQELYKLVLSDSLWERRIAVMATYHFIRQHQYEDTLELSKQLLKDREDLIHKVVGWMLREIGKRDIAVEKAFLKTHYPEMPRTMLRYAIEKFPEKERKRYLAGTI